MGRENEAVIARVFHEAVDQPPAERPAFLDRACGADAALRARVEELLAALGMSDDFLVPRPDVVTEDAVATTTVGDAPPSAGEGPGSRIGRYKLLQLIGEGGFGSVFMAEQEHPVKRRVALKIIKPGMDTKQVIARFEAERQALAMMDHPNIAKVFDAGETSTGRPYSLMELVKGKPITEYCDENKLDTRSRLELFTHVCRAVQHAHQKAVIHRDIKPSNVLVTVHEDGKPVPKVIDFGIAKATQTRLTEKTLFTEFRQFIGTPEYMSPEQADAAAMDVDTRSDVYSLGVLLYELLTGTTPFDPKELRSKAYGEIQRIIREVDPPKPSTRLGSLAGNLSSSVAAKRQTEPRKLGRLLRGDLDWVVMKCLEKDRTRRYEAAAGLGADVSRYLSNEPVSAGPPGAVYRVQKFAIRHKGLLAAVAVVALALMLGLVAGTYGLIRARQERASALKAKGLETAERQKATEQAAEAHKQQLLALAQKGRAEEREKEAALRLGDRFVRQGDLFASTQRFDEARALYRQAVNLFEERGASTLAADLGQWDIERQRPSPLYTYAFAEGSDNDYRGPHAVISEDGVCLLSFGNRLEIWDAAIGARRTFFGANAGQFWWAAISYDRSRIATGGPDGILRLWDAGTGSEIAKLDAGGTAKVAFRGGGHHVLTARIEGAVTEWDAEHGKQLAVLSGSKEEVTSLTVSHDGHLVLIGRLNSVELWDLDTHTPIHSYPLRGVECTAFAPDAKTFVIGRRYYLRATTGPTAGTTRTEIISDGDPLEIWDAQAGTRIRSLQLEADQWRSVSAVAYSADGEVVASAERGNTASTVRIWDPRTGRNLRDISTHQCEGVTFSADSRLLYAWGYGRFDVWGKDAEQIRYVFGAIAGTNDAVLYGKTLAFAPDGRMAAWAEVNGSLVLADAATGRTLARTKPHSSVPAYLTFSSDCRTVFSVDHKAIDSWDVVAGDHSQLTFDTESSACSAAVSTDGSVVLVGGWDGTLRLWDFKRRSLIQSLPAHATVGRARDRSHLREAVTCVALSPGGKYALSGGNDGTVILWDLSNAVELNRLSGNRGVVNFVAFSSDGTKAVSDWGDGAITVFEIPSCSASYRATGVKECVSEGLFSDEGRFVVGATTSGAVVWDAREGREVRSVFRDAGWLKGLTISPNGRQALIRRANGIVELLDFSIVSRMRALEPTLEQSRKTYANRPNDPLPRSLIGEWYATRGATAPAAKLLEDARALGGDFPCLTLARCYWQLGRLDDARREFAAANRRQEAPSWYLELCMSAVGEPRANAR